jgi:hypothetical protein
MSTSSPTLSNSEKSRAPIWQGALIGLAGLLLLVGCFSGPFTTYDDIQHIKVVSEAVNDGALGFLKPKATWSYFPVTILTYQFDRALFSQVLHINNWAPGVRFMTFLYHAGAALALWRFLLLLGLSRMQAFLVALIFAVHPMACETVGWVSERKNALAALFGFLALWTWLGLRRDAGETAELDRAKRWRVPITVLLYLLALLSKPSALGLLPLFGLLEFFPISAAGYRAETPGPLFPRRILRAVLSCLPLGTMAIAVAVLNIKTHAPELVKPPGGTLFTALLTDLEIISRYLFNMLAPIRLSAFYFVDPILSLSDPRVWIYGLALCAAVAVTLYLAENRKLAAFSWAWFISGLGPNLNLVAIPLFMQDRYAYLSTPAFFLVLIQVAAGVRTRLKLSPVTLRIVACSYLAMLALLAIQRSGVWYNAATIFADAVEKQPKSANARYALGMAYAQAAEAESRAGHAELSQDFSHQAAQQWRRAIDECSDAGRFAFFAEMALRAGEDLRDRGDAVNAEKYFRLAAYPPPAVPPFAPMMESALRALIKMFDAQGRFGEAFTLSNDLIHTYGASDDNVFARARSAYLYAQELQRKNQMPRDTQLLLQLARTELLRIAPESGHYPAAQEFLKLLNTEH